jgi:RNA polymerase sigma factor (sigma-70 family)
MIQNYVEYVERAQRGDDPFAFEMLVENFQQMVYAAALRILNDETLAEDAAQETFLVAYQQLHQLRDPRAFPGWLRAITRSQCTRMLRRETASLEPLDPELIVEAFTPEQLLEDYEQQQTVSMAIQRLPDSQRDITERFYLHEQSQQEIASALALPLTTVKKRLQYAREHLRQFFIELAFVTDEIVGMKPPEPRQAKLARVPVPVYRHPRLNRR